MLCLAIEKGLPGQWGVGDHNLALGEGDPGRQWQHVSDRLG